MLENDWCFGQKTYPFHDELGGLVVGGVDNPARQDGIQKFPDYFPGGFTSILQRFSDSAKQLRAVLLIGTCIYTLSHRVNE